LTIERNNVTYGILITVQVERVLGLSGEALKLRVNELCAFVDKARVDRYLFVISIASLNVPIMTQRFLTSTQSALTIQDEFLMSLGLSSNNPMSASDSLSMRHSETKIALVVDGISLESLV
jgi:hypothetical protein